MNVMDLQIPSTHLLDYVPHVFLGGVVPSEYGLDHRLVHIQAHRIVNATGAAGFNGVLVEVIETRGELHFAAYM